ncbi:MAG: GGDEF domain-containing protein [Planctomycetota bacterium]|jgi:diguanylate cyclase (GGDEF)-like protein
MSEATTSERSRHGRVLTVGDSPALQRVRSGLRAAHVHAKNLFEAIGEVTVASASEAIDAVLIDEDVCRGASISGVRALRRVDPAVQLILICTDGAAPDQATAAAFDHCLRGDVAAQELNALLGFAAAESVAPTAPAPTSAPTESPAAPAPSLPPASAVTPTSPNPPPAPPAEPPLVESVPRPAASAPQPATSIPETSPLPPEALVGVDPEETPAPASASPAAPTMGGLGDVDLVRAVIDDPAGVLETALRLLREQTGWSDVQFGPDERPVGRAASVAVEHRGHTYGRLLSCHALDRELRPWADWLAHWLALDRHYREYRTMAFRDELTAAWNRRFFFSFLARSIERARQQRRSLTLMIFDIDDFKRYNDDFGHAAGDEILVETVRLLRSVIRRGDRVCRIGGDEFAVVFADPEPPREPGSTLPETVEHIARRFQDQISRMRFPKLGLEAPGTLSISGGLATYPWDGVEPLVLLELADQRALQSKRMGKNVITFGPGAEAVEPRGEG